MFESNAIYSRILNASFLCIGMVVMVLVGLTACTVPVSSPPPSIFCNDITPAVVPDPPLTPPAIPIPIPTNTPSFPPCPPSVPTETPAARWDAGFGNPIGLTRDYPHSQLLDVASSRTGSAILWYSDGDTFLATTSNSNNPTVEKVSVATSYAGVVAFSPKGRLWVVYRESSGLMTSMYIESQSTIDTAGYIPINVTGVPLDLVIDEKTGLAILLYQDTGDVKIMYQSLQNGAAVWQHTTPYFAGFGDTGKIAMSNDRVYLVYRAQAMAGSVVVGSKSFDWNGEVLSNEDTINLGTGSFNAVRGDVSISPVGDNVMLSWIEKNSVTESLSLTLSAPIYDVISATQTIEDDGNYPFYGGIRSEVYSIPEWSTVSVGISATVSGPDAYLQVGLVEHLGLESDIVWSAELHNTGIVTTTIPTTNQSVLDVIIRASPNSTPSKIELNGIYASEGTIWNSEFLLGSYSTEHGNVADAWRPWYSSTLTDTVYGVTTERYEIISEVIDTSTNVSGGRVAISQNSVPGDDIQGEYRSRAVPLSSDISSTAWFVVYGEGDKPVWNPFAKRYGRLRTIVCDEQLLPNQSPTNCSSNPGDKLTDDERVIDVVEVMADISETTGVGVIVWESWQHGMVGDSSDIYFMPLNGNYWRWNKHVTVSD